MFEHIKGDSFFHVSNQVCVFYPDRFFLWSRNQKKFSLIHWENSCDFLTDNNSEGIFRDLPLFGKVTAGLNIRFFCTVFFKFFYARLVSYSSSNLVQEKTAGQRNIDSTQSLDVRAEMLALTEKIICFTSRGNYSNSKINILI